MKTKHDEDFYEETRLILTDEELDGIKGGPSGEFIRPPDGGGFINNHNETIMSDEEDEDRLADLSVIDEESERVEGGPTVLAWARVDGPPVR